MLTLSDSFEYMLIRVWSRINCIPGADLVPESIQQINSHDAPLGHIAFSD
jgi:hypothetical protein